jgi:hypothetical protein
MDVSKGISEERYDFQRDKVFFLYRDLFNESADRTFNSTNGFECLNNYFLEMVGIFITNIFFLRPVTMIIDHFCCRPVRQQPVRSWRRRIWGTRGKPEAPGSFERATALRRGWPNHASMLTETQTIVPDITGDASVDSKQLWLTGESHSTAVRWGL